MTTTDPAARPTPPRDPGDAPSIETAGPGPSGLTRGLVWSELAAEMRAEAAAAGDDRFERVDAFTGRRATPFEAQPIDLARVRAERESGRRSEGRAA